MPLKKVVSSPIFATKGANSINTHIHLSEPFLEEQKSWASNPMSISSALIEDQTEITETDDGESDHSSNKAAFYIGDENHIQTRTSETLFPKGNKSVTIQSTDHINGNKKPKPSIPLVPEFIPPDGGYGWVIAFSACVVNVFIVGFLKSYGVLYVSIQRKFPDSSAYQASWLPVFLSTTGLLIAPVTGILCRKFTSRKVSFLGGVLAFAGIFGSAFATSMTQMIFSMGFLTGLGAGLTTTPGVLITSLYFEKRRTLASAICVSGNAIGGFMFPPLTEYLLTNYGLSGALYFLAALQLHICAASMLYRPIRLHAMIQHKENIKNKYLPDEKEKLVEQCSKVEKHNFMLQGEESLAKRILTKRLMSTSDEEDEEMQYQFSFLRSASMMNSIPDLTQYARSWSTEASMNQQSSIKNIHIAYLANRKSNKSINELERNFSFNTRETRNAKVRPTIMGQLPEIDSNSGSLTHYQNGIMSKQPLTRLVSNDSSIISNNNTKYTNMHLSLTPKNSIPLTDSSLSKLTNDNLSEKILYEENENNKQKSIRFFDSELLCNPMFWLLSFTVAMMAVGAPHALFFLPAYADYVNVDSGSVIYIMSISSLIDLVGRLSTGFISDYKFCKSWLLYAMFEMSAGIALFLLPSVSSLTGIGVLLGFYGFGVGGWFVLIPSLLASHHGMQRLAASYGLVRMFQGMMNFVSPQISGLLVDVSGNYKYIYYFMGTSMTFGGMCMFINPCLEARAKSRAIIDEKKANINDTV